MTLTKDQLLVDLLIAYHDASRHKHDRQYVIDFEKDLMKNLTQIRDELYERFFEHGPFTTFIAPRPHPREIFAANFRDRIVHHLYYNYLHKQFESTFIYDCYSCIKKRGTSFGIQRLKHHILSESQNYTKKCYVLKIDIKAYFININRKILLNIVLNQIDKFEKSHKYDYLDFDFLRYLSKLIILLDPLKNIKQIYPEAWETYKKSKSLFFAKLFCGLPIGNLTSQLFSNVYLNLLDQFIKRILKVKHYGRYVDDGYLISCSKEFLLQCIPKIKQFLQEILELEINCAKIIIREVKYGVEFLSAYIKPFRMYIANQTLHRMKINDEIISNKHKLLASLVSRMGYLKTFSSYNIRLKIIDRYYKTLNKNRMRNSHPIFI